MIHVKFPEKSSYTGKKEVLNLIQFCGRAHFCLLDVSKKLYDEVDDSFCII